ncbi:hypothetical protein MLD38_021671 [Melastoma candidum]|uniref:Uncharacterized protein n=1 Tax=Melastoma candidum TaxID=119954 RepID=A0ACB9QJR2_9MYRT|nr:hypothetical protein MLD38_021671 [Melastoma candidum]
MAGGSVSAYKVMRSYWRRRGYEKLASPFQPQPTRRRWIWRPRVRVAPKVKILRLVASSPKKFFLWLRDAYVRMMLKFANSRMFTAGGAPSYYGRSGYGFGEATLKEYDRRVIVEIYRSVLAAQGKLADRPASGKDAGSVEYGPPPLQQVLL